MTEGALLGGRSSVRTGDEVHWTSGSTESRVRTLLHCSGEHTNAYTGCKFLLEGTWDRV